MQFPKMQLSDIACAIPEALSVYMNNVVYEMRRRGDNIHVLSLGEAYFNIPMFPFESIDFQKGYHYSESRGMLELREIIADYYQKQYHAPVDPEREIIISAGSKALIFMAFQAVLNPGDEVLFHEPAWLSYPEGVKIANGVPKFIPYYCDIEEFSNYFTEKTKIIVLNNPNNPAGRIYTEQELRGLYEICRSRGIYLLIDEAYSDFALDHDFHSMVNIVPDKDGIIVVNSLSKNLGISGWRIGYVISSPDVIYNILKLNQHLITCPATVLLMYIVRYFNDIVKCTLPQAQEVVKKRNAVASYVRKAGMQLLPGDTTFYMFINIGDYQYSSLDLALHLLTKYHISVVPGSAYGESTGRFIRIGVGAESFETICADIDIIKQVITENEYDEETVDLELKELGFNRFEAGK